MDLDTPEARIAKWGYDPEGKVNSCSAVTWVSAPTFGIPAAYYLVFHPNPEVQLQSLIALVNTLVMLVIVSILVALYPLNISSILWYFLIGYTILGVIVSFVGVKDQSCPEHEWEEIKARDKRAI